jgi:hypothetical protein
MLECWRAGGLITIRLGSICMFFRQLKALLDAASDVFGV